jgi:hypothetical protein
MATSNAFAIFTPAVYVNERIALPFVTAAIFALPFVTAAIFALPFVTAAIFANCIKTKERYCWINKRWRNRGIYLSRVSAATAHWNL